MLEKYGLPPIEAWLFFLAFSLAAVLLVALPLKFGEWLHPKIIKDDEGDLQGASPDLLSMPPEKIELYGALVQRMARLFFRIDPKPEATEPHDSLSAEDAKVETSLIFDEFAEIVLEGYDGKIFKSMNSGVPTYQLSDDAYGILYLEDGDRARFVDFLYDRLRVCGVDRAFCDDAYEVYCMSDDEDEEGGPESA